MLYIPIAFLKLAIDRYITAKNDSPTETSLLAIQVHSGEAVPETIACNKPIA